MKAKAVRIHAHGGPEVLKYEDVELAAAPPVGQVLVGIKAVGVNPVDTYIRDGNFYKCQFPTTLGMDGAGIVEAVGSGVENVKVGDNVYVQGGNSGTYATKALCPAGRVWKLPDRFSFAQGACLGVPYGTAHRALFHHGNVKQGTTVLIHGASGGVGLAAVQLATAAGAFVVGSASTTQGKDLVLKNGAKHVVDHKKPEHFDEALGLTPDRKGFDVIIEMLANVNLGKDLPILAPRGKVVVVGNRGVCPELNARDLMMKDASVVGMALGNASLDELAVIHADLYKNPAVQPIIAKEFPLSEAAKAHVAQMEPGMSGNIVLKTE